MQVINLLDYIKRNEVSLTDKATSRGQGIWHFRTHLANIQARHDGHAMAVKAASPVNKTVVRRGSK
jgi:hypothetical protein